MYLYTTNLSGEGNKLWFIICGSVQINVWSTYSSISFLSSFLQVHVCLLVCEARLQAELLYGLRAVSEHYNFQA